MWQISPWWDMLRTYWLSWGVLFFTLYAYCLGKYMHWWKSLYWLTEFTWLVKNYAENILDARWQHYMTSIVNRINKCEYTLHTQKKKKTLSMPLGCGWKLLHRDGISLKSWMRTFWVFPGGKMIRYVPFTFFQFLLKKEKLYYCFCHLFFKAWIFLHCHLIWSSIYLEAMHKSFSEHFLWNPFKEVQMSEWLRKEGYLATTLLVCVCVCVCVSMFVFGGLELINPLANMIIL